MNSDDLILFAKVAEMESFSRAAEIVGLSKSAVSKRIAHLEQHLGTSLINRTPRSISLTDSGRLFLEHCRKIERSLLRAEEVLKGQDSAPSGLLRISLPTNLGTLLMPSMILDFQAQYPDLNVSAHFLDPFVDVVGGGYDVVIRVARKLNDSSLLAQKLSSSLRVLVASPAYLNAYGTPTHVKDLVRHKCVGFGYGSEAVIQWGFVGPEGPIDVPVTYGFTANNGLALNLAACLGMGLLYTPKVLVESELARHYLEMVLPEFCNTPPYGVYALYPQKQPAAKVRVFIEFVRERLEEVQKLDLWSPLTRISR